MRKVALALLLTGALLSSNSWASDTLSISLVADASNPPSPQMGDWLKFHSVVTNVAGRSAHGVVAWISLVQVDPGKEQPVDLWRIGARTKP